MDIKNCPKCNCDMVKKEYFSEYYTDEKRSQNGTIYQSQIPVHAYICQKCGYIEQYADLKEDN